MRMTEVPPATALKATAMVPIAGAIRAAGKAAITAGAGMATQVVAMEAVAGVAMAEAAADASGSHSGDKG